MSDWSNQSKGYVLKALVLDGCLHPVSVIWFGVLMLFLTGQQMSNDAISKNVVGCKSGVCKVVMK